MFLVLYSICILAVWLVSVSYWHLPVGIFGRYYCIQFCEILRELHFVKLAGTYFSLGGLDPSKRGQKPPFEGKKGFPPNVKYRKPYRVFLRYRYGKYRENTNRYRTEIPNRDTTLDFFYSNTLYRRWCPPSHHLFLCCTDYS